MERPVCPRCNGPLDLEPDVDDPGQWRLACNNRHKQVTPLQNDETFRSAWGNLPGDEVVRLEKQLTNRR